MNKEIEINKKVLLCFVVVFLLGMLVCSAYTSPLYPNYYWGDSALFSLVGKGMVEGKVVYKDLFDHKGPTLFFIEALGYSIGKTTGIFVVQCIFGVINLFLSYCIWKKVASKKGKKTFADLAWVFITNCALFFYTFESGNLSEELSLPFIFVCVLLFVNYAQKCEEDAKHPYWYSFVYGAALMSLALIRLNNAITILAGVLAIVVFLIYKKEYKNMLINILFGCLGICTVALPVVVYFAYKSALYDMIYATFIYNFLYAGNTSHQAILANPWKYAALYSPMVISAVLMLGKIKKKRKLNFLDFCIMMIVICNTICLLILNLYTHYFTVYVPVFVLVLSAYFTYERKSFRNLLIALCIGVYLLYAGYDAAKHIYRNYISDAQEKQYHTIATEIKQIPLDERDAVIGYKIPSEYYLQADIVPCFKYYTMQEWWSRSNPAIKTSFLEYIAAEDTLWLLTCPDEDDSHILEIISERYVLVAENEYFNMYRTKDDG